MLCVDTSWRTWEFAFHPTSTVKKPFYMWIFKPEFIRFPFNPYMKFEIFTTATRKLWFNVSCLLTEMEVFAVWPDCHGVLWGRVGVRHHETTQQNGWSFCLIWTFAALVNCSWVCDGFVLSYFVFWGGEGGRYSFFVFFVFRWYWPWYAVVLWYSVYGMGWGVWGIKGRDVHVN